ILLIHFYVEGKYVLIYETNIYLSVTKIHCTGKGKQEFFKF
ncbi:unnamed protein product, partial [Rotaria magnacalcarata]